MTSTCRHCGAELLWATTSRGNKIPLDPDPSPDGRVVLALGVAHVLSPHKPLPARTRYLPHFATCPATRQDALPGF